LELKKKEGDMSGNPVASLTSALKQLLEVDCWFDFYEKQGEVSDAQVRGTKTRFCQQDL